MNNEIINYLIKNRPITKTVDLAMLYFYFMLSVIQSWGTFYSRVYAKIAFTATICQLMQTLVELNTNLKLSRTKSYSLVSIILCFHASYPHACARNLKFYLCIVPPHFVLISHNAHPKRVAHTRTHHTFQCEAVCIIVWWYVYTYIFTWIACWEAFWWKMARAERAVLIDWLGR